MREKPGTPKINLVGRLCRTQQRRARYIPEGSRPSGQQCFHCLIFGATSTRMSETDTNESAHKWPGFDVPVPNFEPAEGKVVGLSCVHANGLELLLEIEVEGKCNFVLAESGASV
jgi:hypothetical protein